MIVPVETRVARRYLARDFPSEKALEKYLHEHPKADPHKHHVTEHEDKGHGESEGHGDSDEHGEHGHSSMFSRLKGALKTIAQQFKDAPKDVQKFIGDTEHRKKALKKGVAGLKKAAPKYYEQLVKTTKDEVKEFKTAGEGIAAAIKGGKPTAKQKHAMKAVAKHMAITIAGAVLTTASPALAVVAAGKSLCTHIALKAATEAVSDLHVLHEMHHIGHHAAHPLLHAIHHVLEHVRLAEDGGGKEADPEALFAVLVAKHVAEQMQNIDDDTLAKGLGGDDEEGDDDDEGQQKQARRVAARYLDALPPVV